MGRGRNGQRHRLDCCGPASPAVIKQSLNGRRRTPSALPYTFEIEQFRSAYFYYADTGREADVRAIGAFWRKRWLETNDRYHREFEIRVERRFPSSPFLPVAA